MELEGGSEKDRKTDVAKVLKYIVEILRFVKFVACPLKRFSDNKIFGNFCPEFIAFSSGVRVSFVDTDFFLRIGERVYLFSAFSLANDYFPLEFQVSNFFVTLSFSNFDFSFDSMITGFSACDD